MKACVLLMPHVLLALHVLHVLSVCTAGAAGHSAIVVNTWNFVAATNTAWETLEATNSSLESVVAGCAQCERDRCDGTVGWGGSPDENGETTLDAMVMYGPTHDVGAVAGLRRIKNAVGVAQAVLQRTAHSMLVGDAATEFAIMMGFEEESLTSEESYDKWQQWQNSSCQPNYWQNVEPDPEENCGPYYPSESSQDMLTISNSNAAYVNQNNHDTIGMVAVSGAGDISVGTSTNGLSHKIPGRVGDTAIVGAGGYVDNQVGAAVATGDGDVLVRFLPCLKTVENMRRGWSPGEAAQLVFDEMLALYPDMQGGVVAVTADGQHGAACSFGSFTYSVRTAAMETAEVISVQC